MIKAVFFDAGGTLFKPYPSVGEVYSEVARRYGLTQTPQVLEQAFHTAWRERDGLASLSHRTSEKEERKWWRSLVWEVLSPLGRIENFEAFFEELYDRFARPETWRLFSDTLPTLQKLKTEGKVLGIISNWDSRLFGICEGLGLGPYLDLVVASAAVGAAKPNPKIFQEALRQARVLPEEAVHVGDSLEDDVLGAERVGMRAIFLDRTGERATRALTISSLQFLWKAIEND